MKKEAKILLDKSVESLILSIEIFNRPNNIGRVNGVLIFLDHAMELLLKSSILQKGGRIREKGAKQTLGFDACVRKGLSTGSIKFLSHNQALTLQNINALRDAAQHYMLDISEQHLYLQTQSGLTLFKDIMNQVFNQEIKEYLPDRVLPLSTVPPVDIPTLFNNEVEEVKKLLKPGSRRQIEAKAKLRALAIMESSVNGEKLQPSDSDLRKIAIKIKNGDNWDKIFPGVATINFSTKGYGPSIDLRITKKQGTPVTIVPEGTPGATVIALKKVNELGFYKLSRDQVAKQVGLTGPKTTSAIRYFKIQEDSECFKNIIFGKVKFQRYSDKAVKRISEGLKSVSIDEVWKQCGIKSRKKG